MKYLFLICSILILHSCTKTPECEDCTGCSEDLGYQEMTIEQKMADVNKNGVTKVDTNEMKSSIAKIEAKYGEQWDFCSCVIKGDSINKALAKGDLPDAVFNQLAKRFDEIDIKCQAFRIQDPNLTPEQRELHEKKVRKCLKQGGIR